MIHYPDHQQTRKNKAHEIEINLNCPQCHSKTYPCLINEKEMMLTCQNNKCLFPLNSENMQTFIFPQNSLKESIERISLLLKEEGGNSTNISNNSYYEKTHKTMQTDSPIVVNNIQCYISEDTITKEINLFNPQHDDFFTFNSD